MTEEEKTNDLKGINDVFVDELTAMTMEQAEGLSAALRDFHNKYSGMTVVRTDWLHRMIGIGGRKDE